MTRVTDSRGARMLPATQVLILFYLAIVLTLTAIELQTLTRQSIDASVAAVIEASKVRADLVAAQALQVRLLQVICYNTTANKHQAEKCLTAPGTIEPSNAQRRAAGPKALAPAPAAPTPPEREWWRFWERLFPPADGPQ